MLGGLFLTDANQLTCPNPRAAYASMEAAHASLKALAEEVEGARDAAVAQYSSELDAGGLEPLAWLGRSSLML